MKKGIIITLIVLAAIGIAAGLYYWFRKKPSTPDPEAPKQKPAVDTPAATSINPDKINSDAVKQPIMPQAAVDEIPATPFVFVKSGINDTQEIEVNPGFGRA